MLTVTVSQLNRYVKAILEEDKNLAEVYVKGEISNYTLNFRSGHAYLTLKDSQSSIKAVIFKSSLGNFAFTPENGMMVIARATVSLYERDGNYQLYITDIQPDGAGAFAVGYEQQKIALEKLGLFDERHKKEIPRYPKRIGIITSQTGAVLHDITSVLSRRYPLCTVVVCPSSVQGEYAAESIIAAIDTLDNKGGCDVIIIARGGGSAEDLWCFNDTKLAHTIFNCKTPIISAVGHQTDFTICDFVADLRAPTPSAAAEMVSLPIEEIASKLDYLKEELESSITNYIYSLQKKLSNLDQSIERHSPKLHLIKSKEKLDFITKEMYNRKCIFIRQKKQQLAHNAALLDTLSPLNTLGRGFSIALKDRAVISDVDKLSAGDGVEVIFKNGLAKMMVTTIQKNIDITEIFSNKKGGAKDG